MDQIVIIESMAVGRRPVTCTITNREGDDLMAKMVCGVVAFVNELKMATSGNDPVEIKESWCRDDMPEPHEQK